MSRIDPELYKISTDIYGEDMRKDIHDALEILDKSIDDIIVSGGVPPTDAILSKTSTNPVQNRIITQALENKQTAIENLEARIDNIDTTGTVDSALNSTSVNPVQNKVVYQAVIQKLDKSEYNYDQSDILQRLTTLEGESGVTIDTQINENSTNPVQNKAIYTELNKKAAKTTVNTIVQNALELDQRIQTLEGSVQTPISSISKTSTSPVQSKAIYTALTGKVDSTTYTNDKEGILGRLTILEDEEGITVDTALSSKSKNPVQNKVINTALAAKVDLTTYTNDKEGILGRLTILEDEEGITVDTTITNTSTHPVTSKAIYTALSKKATVTSHNVLASRVTAIENQPFRPRLCTMHQAYANWRRGYTFPIAFLGDSTFAGRGVTKKAGSTADNTSLSFPNLFLAMMKSECTSNVKVYNVSLSGAKLQYGIDNFDNFFVDSTKSTYCAGVRMVVIGLGINDRLDYTHGLDYYSGVKSKLRVLIERCFGAGIQPVLSTHQATTECGVRTDYTSSYPIRRTEVMLTYANTAKFELAEEYNLEIIDLTKFTEFCLAYSKVPANSMVRDQLHFNDYGNILEAGYIFKQFSTRVIDVDESGCMLDYSNQGVRYAPPQDWITQKRKTLLKLTKDGSIYRTSAYVEHVDTSSTADRVIFDAVVSINSKLPMALYVYGDGGVTVGAKSYVYIDGRKYDKPHGFLEYLDVGVHHITYYTNKYEIFYGVVISRGYAAVNKDWVEIDPDDFFSSTGDLDMISCDVYKKSNLIVGTLRFSSSVSTAVNGLYGLTGYTIASAYRPPNDSPVYGFFGYRGSSDEIYVPANGYVQMAGGIRVISGEQSKTYNLLGLNFVYII